MLLTLHFFYLGIFGVIVSSVLVVESRNPVYSAFFLLAAFIFAGLFLLGVGVEFLALNLIILYVGAIIVLFLLVIMLVNQRQNIVLSQNTPVISLVGYSVLYAVLKTFISKEPASLAGLDFLNHRFIQDPRVELGSLINYYQDINMFGYHLYTSNFLVLIMCGFLLLIAMICSLILILRIQTKFQSVFA